ncbi:MAG TPA: peptide-methionine (R)-S-oxide reductase MsrB [Rhodanobacteraceae bacterium]|nr:peptide-methionine (R)-S-oxide reductase MsrB [Rhodanobacteraceae bacterium]
MPARVHKTDEEWRRQLGEERYAICRLAATEAPGSGRWYGHFDEGTYSCACCGAELFGSDDKFRSGCGWPSFSAPVTAEAVTEREDASHGMQRIEIRCANCDAHLGHRFTDGPPPSGMRYCINSLALDFESRD